MQVAKWGNSLALRIPAAVVKALDLVEGDDIEVTVASDRRFAISKTPRVIDHLTRMRAYRGRIPPGFRFDRDEANGR